MIDVDSCDYDATSFALPPVIDIGQRAMVRVRMYLGRYWAQPTMGSQLSTLTKAVPQVGTLCQQYVTAALQPLVQDGSVASLSVSAQLSATTLGRVDWVANLVLPDGSNVAVQDFVSVRG